MSAFSVSSHDFIILEEDDNDGIAQHLLGMFKAAEDET